MINNSTQQSSHTSQQSLKSRAIKGKREGWLSVGELSGRALAARARGPGFDPRRCHLSFPLPFQRSTDSNGPDCLIRQSLSVFGLWKSPIHRTPHAVIMLTNHNDRHLHTATIHYFSTYMHACMLHALGSTSIIFFCMHAHHYAFCFQVTKGLIGGEHTHLDVRRYLSIPLP